MTFFISNNTTYNYSYYATRPKWLIESLLKESLSQKEFKNNPSYSKESTPIHKIAFTPWPQKLKNEKYNVKQQNTNISHLKAKSSQEVGVIQIQTKNQTISLQKLKHKSSATRLKTTKTHSKKLCRRLFQTKELLCWTSDLSFFNLRGYFSNLLKVLQICRFAVRNNQKILFVKSSSSSYGQGKALNPWLVQYKRNTVPIKLSNLFNKSYLNPTQRLVSPQILYLKNNKETNQGKKDLHRIINIPKYSLLRQEESKKVPVPNTLVKNSLKANLLEKHSNRLKEINTPKNRQSDYSTPYYRRYYQLNSILNNYLNIDFGDNYSNKTSHFKNRFLFSSHFKNQKKVSKPWESGFCLKERLSKIENKQKKTISFVNLYLKSLNDVSQGQGLKNQNQYLHLQSRGRISKKTTVRIDNIIKLWIKEAQIISQQTAVGLTIPLTGFLTNSKTTFNTIYNLSNDDAYNSISSNLKSNSLSNTGTCKIKTNRLENIHFQKNIHRFPQTLPKHLQDKDLRPLKFGQSLAFPLTLGPLAFEAKATTRAKKNNNRLKTHNSIKSLKYRIRQKPINGRQQNGLETLAFSFPRIYKSWKLTTSREIEKDKKKKLIQYKDSNLDITSNLKNQNAQGFRQKAWWANYYNSHNYLALASNARGNTLLKDNDFITCSEKSKKPRPLEYCFFGDVFTWQSRSQKSSSMFYSNSSFSKNKENVISYLKKQVILEKRGPIIFKRKKRPFFTHFKKQLQGFKNPTLQLKEPFNYITHNPWQKQTKNCFLRKTQFLSKFAQFIVFYLNESSILLKNRTNWAKKNQAHIHLPSFSTIKRTVKLNLNSRNFGKDYYKPTYGYNIAFHTLERILNRLNRIKVLEPLPPGAKPEENMPRKRQFFKTFDRGHQKNKKRSQKRLTLRPLLFYKYYKTIIALNHFNQYKMFAKTPFVNNRLADIIFFINPEKNQNLVNQANCLKIPTVGIISGNMVSAQSHQGYDNFRLKDSVYYPILGNPISNFFTRAIVSLIVKFLRVEKSKNKWSHR